MQFMVRRGTLGQPGATGVRSRCDHYNSKPIVDLCNIIVLVDYMTIYNPRDESHVSCWFNQLNLVDLNLNLNGI